MKTETKLRKRICQICWYEKWAPDQYFPDDYGKGYEMSYDCDFCGDAGITTSIWIDHSEFDDLSKETRFNNLEDADISNPPEEVTWFG